MEYKRLYTIVQKLKKINAMYVKAITKTKKLIKLKLKDDSLFKFTF